MLSESTALAKLAQGEPGFPPLEVSLVSAEARVEAPDRKLDWILELTWRDERIRFVVEYTRLSTPKNLRAAINQLQSFQGTLDLWDEPNELYPMLMAPYLGEDDLEELMSRDLSGIDFCGNGIVIVPGRWLIYRTGEPNQYPSSYPIKRIYQGKSSLVGRLLLVQREFDQISDVKREIEARDASISLSTVSKVLQVLEEKLVISRENRRVSVLQPDLLLDELTRNFEWPEDLERVRGKLPDTPDQLPDLARIARESGLKFAVSGSARYAQMPTSDWYPPIYVESLQRFTDEIDFEEGGRFSNAELRETASPLVYFDRREEQDVYWTSPVQTYLGLANGGKREKEIAQEMRPKLLEQTFG